MAGIFKSTKTMDKFTVVAEWQERALGPKEPQERLKKINETIKEKTASRDKVRSEERTALLARIQPEKENYIAAGKLQIQSEQEQSSLKPVLSARDGRLPTDAIMLEAENSLVILLVLWLYMLVIVGISVKYYTFISKLTFNRLLIQKNLSLCFSYGGFTLGAGFIIASCFDQEHYEITVFCIQVLLKTILSLIIFPLFKKGLVRIFPIRMTEARAFEGEIDTEMQSLGYGFYEGCIFISGAILTTMIVNRIQFGTIYPFF
jgi:hypothetical protein